MTKKVILKDENDEELIPYTSLATGAEAGRVRPDGTTLGVDSNGILSVNQGLIDTVDGKISNCILEIPQNIKVTLENNVLTVKSGSILTLTGDTYATATTNHNVARTYNSLADGRYFIFMAGNLASLGAARKISEVGSGDTVPDSSSSLTAFYNTADKKMYQKENNVWTVWNVVYPLCIIEASDGAVSFAKDSNGNDMIFNGMGFVGHHIFIYPNINAYMPTELNPDGSLASTKIGTNALRIIEALSGYGVDSLKRWISLQSNRTVLNWSAYKEVNHDSEADYSIANIRYYARDINLIKMYRSGSVSAVDGVPLVEYYYDGSNITSFTPKQCARLVTVDMLPDSYTKEQVDTLLNMKADTATTLTGYGITDAYTKTEVNTALAGKASTSLDNLSAAGQMIIDSQNGTISNCVLEIPQNLKLEISGDTFTIKSGSTIVLVGETYTTYTLTSDTTVDYSTILPTVSNGLYYIFANSNGTVTRSAWIRNTNCFSGTPLPNASDYSNGSVFFETSEKKKWFNNNGTWVNLGGSYPLGLFEVKNHQLSFAKDSNGNDMIFNGMGFIGHHAFIYPNVRKLICNGKADGKLNSYDELVNGLYIVDLGQSIGTRAVISRNGNTYFSNIYWEVDKYSDLVAQSGVQYCRETNYCYSYTNGIFNEQSRLALAYITHDGTTVTDFTIRQPVRTATVEMLDKKQDVLTFDSTPTQNSTNPVTSGGIYMALGTKQSTLTFDTTPTVNSTNPVTSGGIYNAINGAKTYRGAHDLTIQYYAGDIVKSGTEFFEALQDNINVVTSNTTNWSKLSNDNVVRYYEKNDDVEYPIGLANSNASGTGYKGNLFFTAQNKPTINASTGTVTATGGVVGKTETAGDNSTKYASTAFVQTELANKFQVVTTLPVNPDANTFYFIVEEEENESEGE